jgi:hypothetical protein
MCTAEWVDVRHGEPQPQPQCIYRKHRRRICNALCHRHEQARSALIPVAMPARPSTLPGPIAHQPCASGCKVTASTVYTRAHTHTGLTDCVRTLAGVTVRPRGGLPRCLPHGMAPGTLQPHHGQAARQRRPPARCGSTPVSPRAHRHPRA